MVVFQSHSHRIDAKSNSGWGEEDANHLPVNENGEILENMKGIIWFYLLIFIGINQ